VGITARRIAGKDCVAFVPLKEEPAPADETAKREALIQRIRVEVEYSRKPHPPHKDIVIGHPGDRLALKEGGEDTD
jgi:hypothetical protein